MSTRLFDLTGRTALIAGSSRGLGRAMAAEWAGAGIQANAIGPGYMLTDMNKALVNDPAFNA